MFLPIEDLRTLGYCGKTVNGYTRFLCHKNFRCAGFGNEQWKSRLYEYVRDQHDKLLAVRQGQKTRIGLLLVINGFLITTLVTFLIPSSIRVLENAHHLVPRVLVGISAIVLLHVLVYLGRALWASLSALARVGFAVPDVSNEKIRKAILGDDFAEEYAAASLTPVYLEAIEANYRQNQEAGIQVHNTIWCTRVAVVAILVLAFLVPCAQLSDVLLHPAQPVATAATTQP
jgi:hypothetical protein